MKRIRSVRDNEYVFFNDYYIKEGIIHEVTTTYSSKSNGVIRREKYES